MKIINLIDEDFTNYKKPAMFIGFPHCTFKCDKECGKHICQNSALANSPTIEMSPYTIVKRYMENDISESIVFGGLEPFDDYNELLGIIKLFREQTDSDIIVYTGYTEAELEDKLPDLKAYKNIIIKFGRFVPDQKEHFDDILGVKLASDNQYAKRIS